MLIAFTGLPSAGKSSTARALGKLLGATSFVEPEEEDWPQLVHNREQVGAFTALSWFRSARVPALFAAAEIRSHGGVAIVDSYYDKLVSLYLEQDCFSWLLPKADPYFKVALEMARVDYAQLPVADILIFLRLDESTWRRFSETRGRIFDESAQLLKNFEMQRHLEDASRTASEKWGMRLCIVEQTWSSPDKTARIVRDILKASD